MTDLTESGGKVRLHVDAPLGEGVRVVPDAGQSHYLLHVMRAKAGDAVSLFNGRDGEWRARVADITKRSCVFVCEAQIAKQSETPDIWLAFAPIKKTPADYVVQKATELGVRALQPVFTRRTIVTRINEDRMRANAIEASEQSGRLTVPEIREAMTLEKLLAQWPRERRLMFCDEAGEAPPIAEALCKLPPPLAGGGNSIEQREIELGEGGMHQPLPHVASLRAPSRKGRGEEPWAILTGPEGGFDPAERESIRSQPFVVPVSLGERILRADTAVLAALSVWQALAGDWH